jgi:hypothetical protein
MASGYQTSALSPKILKWATKQWRYKRCLYATYNIVGNQTNSTNRSGRVLPHAVSIKKKPKKGKTHVSKPNMHIKTRKNIAGRKLLYIVRNVVLQLGFVSRPTKRLIKNLFLFLLT